MKRATAGVATLAAVGASLAGVLAMAGPAVAKACQLKPKNPLAPHLVSPCNGATVKTGGAITFTVYDTNSQSRKYHPYINLQTGRKLSQGHLSANTDGNGLYSSMKPLKGHPGEWTYTSKHQIYPTWWDNHKGTYYVQIQQIDSRAGVGSTYYSPIVTLHTS